MLKLEDIIYILYTPRTQDLRLPFRDGKESRAALEGAVREQKGAGREQERAIEAQGEHGGNTGEARGAARFGLLVLRGAQHKGASFG